MTATPCPDCGCPCGATRAPTAVAPTNLDSREPALAELSGCREGVETPRDQRFRCLQRVPPQLVYVNGAGPVRQAVSDATVRRPSPSSLYRKEFTQLRAARAPDTVRPTL